MVFLWNIRSCFLYYTLNPAGKQTFVWQNSRPVEKIGKTVQFSTQERVF